MQRVIRRVHRDETGVSLVFAAIAMIAILGLAAFAIDAGALYQERRELQSGADAAALAIAEGCGLGETCNTSFAEYVADNYADDNATDGYGGIDFVDLDIGAQTVTVKTETETTTGYTVFAPFFAQVLGLSGSTVRAEASAAWGAPASLSVLPLIISDCEWDRVQATGGLHSGPPFSDPQMLFKFHEGNTTDDCAAGPGQDWDGDTRLPGGFGWLDTNADCTAEVSVGSWVLADPGSSPSTGCGASELRDLILGKVVLIPFFEDIRGVGGNGEYRVAGFGGFYVTGYNFGGQFKAPSPGTAPCSGTTRCIAGHPVQATGTEGELGGPDRGVLIIKFTG